MAPPSYVKANGALMSPISAYYDKARLDGSFSEFSAALADIKRRNAELKPIFDRLRAVHECIIIRAESGELETAVRKPGGEMHHLPPRIWNGRVEQRFFWCRMSVRKPFGLAMDGDAFDWIFIPRPSLDALLRSLDGSAPDAEIAPSPALPVHLAPIEPLELASAEVAARAAVGPPPAPEPSQDGEQSPIEPQAERRPRRDHQQTDDRVVIALHRTARLLAPKLSPKPTSALGLAKALLEADPALATNAGKLDTLRDMLNGANDRVNRLVGEGRIDPWWRPYLGLDG
jgi:hypothetical protein